MPEPACQFLLSANRSPPTNVQFDLAPLSVATVKVIVARGHNTGNTPRSPMWWCATSKPVRNHCAISSPDHLGPAALNQPSKSGLSRMQPWRSSGSGTRRRAGRDPRVSLEQLQDAGRGAASPDLIGSKQPWSAGATELLMCFK